MTTFQGLIANDSSGFDQSERMLATDYGLDVAAGSGPTVGQLSERVEARQRRDFGRDPVGLTERRLIFHLLPLSTLSGLIHTHCSLHRRKPALRGCRKGDAVAKTWPERPSGFPAKNLVRRPIQWTRSAHLSYLPTAPYSVLA